MASISTSTAALSLGLQSALGTAATNYLTTLATDTAFPVATPIEQTLPPEHGGDITNTRPTTRRSRSEVTGKTVDVPFTGILHPRSLGYRLRAAGFNVATTGSASLYTHVFTLGPAGSGKLLSAHYKAGTGANRVARVVRDVRPTSLSIRASADQSWLTETMQATGLEIIDETGSESFNPESPVRFSSARGSYTFLLDGGAFSAQNPANAELTFTPQVDADDFRIFQTNRATYDIIGWTAAGSLGGFSFLPAEYAKIEEGIEYGSLLIRYESTSNIPDESAPYSVEFNIANLSARPSQIPATGTDRMRMDVSFDMDDLSGGTQPLTITLVNDVASYA